AFFPPPTLSLPLSGPQKLVPPCAVPHCYVCYLEGQGHQSVARKSPFRLPTPLNLRDRDTKPGPVAVHVASGEDRRMETLIALSSELTAEREKGIAREKIWTYTIKCYRSQLPTGAGSHGPRRTCLEPKSFTDRGCGHLCQRLQRELDERTD